MGSDTRSTTAYTRSFNTFKLGPDYDQVFRTHKVKPVIESLLESHLKDLKYDSSTAGRLCSVIADDVKNRVKMMGYYRYKLVCEVSIFSKTGQTTAKIASRYLWDDKTDTFLNCSYEGDNFFVVVTVAAVYYE